MQRTMLLLYLYALVGLLFTGGLNLTRTAQARRALMITGLVIVNMGTFAVLASLFLVSRLEGSRPPGLVPFLAPYVLPLLLIALTNLALWIVYRRLSAGSGSGR